MSNDRTLIPELSDLSDETAARLLDDLEAVDDAVSGHLVEILTGRIPRAQWCATLASVVGFMMSQDLVSSEDFETMTRMIRSGTAASFRLGMRQPGALA